MKTNLLSFFALIITSACNAPLKNDVVYPNPELAAEIQNQDVESTPAQPVVRQGTYIIVDMSNPSLDLLDTFEVNSIPEIDLAVYEVDSDIYVDQETTIYEDEVLSPEDEITLSEESTLWRSLQRERGRIVGFIGTVPESLLEICETMNHTVVIIEENTKDLYESDLLQYVVESSQEDFEYLYIPISQSEISEVLDSAIEYAKSNGLKVFDRAGESI